MDGSEQSGLPAEINHVDFGPFGIRSLKDGKLLLLLKDEAGTHLTLHPGGPSGLLDLHRTYRRSDGSVVHEPLGAIRREDVGPLLGALGRSVIAGLSPLFRPLRLGWLGHHQIKVLGGYPANLVGFDRLCHRRRRSRLDYDEQLLLQQLRFHEYLEDLHDGPDGAFPLFAWQHGQLQQIGVAYKVTDASGRPHCTWVKQCDLLKSVTRMEEDSQAIFGRFLLRPDEYAARLGSAVRLTRPSARQGTP